tara:strand:+ start:412 stop:636 length:225 start_codon:yes stop_codon:yes gene_type:complete
MLNKENFSVKLDDKFILKPKNLNNETKTMCKHNCYFIATLARSLLYIPTNAFADQKRTEKSKKIIFANQVNPGP